MTADFVLNVQNLTMRFGGLVAVNDVSFTARPQQITAIIGPNGAGKTTLFNCLTGFYKPTAGTMQLNRDGALFALEKMRGHKIARDARLARTFQNIRLFPDLTVLENLLVAHHTVLQRHSQFLLGGLLNLPRYRKAERQSLLQAEHWLEQTGLLPFADNSASSLPYGAQRRLEIARALMTDPVLLCLDEPAAGLNPRESSALNDFLLKIKSELQLSILLIEHDMSVVMKISDHIVVLDYGQKIAEGSADEIRSNADVIRAYLGGDLA